jgi:hypothetical protein
MKKLIYSLAIISCFIAVSCGPSSHVAHQRPSIEQLIEPAIAMINKCSGDTSFNTMAYKAAYSAKDTSFVVFLGKDIHDFTYKWEIPLKLVDRTGMILFRQDYNMSTITLNLYGNQSGVRYYMDKKFRSKSGQFVLYLGKCFSNDDRELILQRLSTSIGESQK